MKIGILTSSRADFGIYLPLLKKLEEDNYFELTIFAFGTHVSRFHGYTIQNIVKNNFQKIVSVETLILGDSEEAISSAIGNTTTKFSSIYSFYRNELDLILALGDRYEMFAAVSAAIPFNIPIGHLHGGETTLGAIDNKFRHAITMMSSIHFTATDSFSERVRDMVGSSDQVFNVGALSLDGFSELPLLPISDFKSKFDIDLSIPTILSTFHSETVDITSNKKYASTIVETFLMLSKKYQIVITMPNADSMGNVIREQLLHLQGKHNVILVENLGKIGYFSCMKHAKMLIGNTSSGIIEAASFSKYVINLGNRQKGRLSSKNVLHSPVDMNTILENVKKIEENDMYYIGDNVYERSESSSDLIIQALKKF